MDNKFEKLRELLLKDNNWPKVYMFKFIVAGDNSKIAQVESLFSTDSVIRTKESSGGKYISITVEELILNPQQIIDIYIQASKIEGIMTL
jgi:hypothetical protein